ncbi:DUF6527 family protein [Nitrosomonas marina]|uniref:Ammonia monooxygenase n=1 Tax=Nitrosomonas marina TaxID=917 RepID=A0A1H8J122_9PROT|nr:DUF6527 family protein [Nitrosomonas marina]SEN73857.1 hypothetical protein SAMN05216325_1465 [Nitrosomonas marina]
MSALSRKLRDTEDNGLVFLCPGCGKRHLIKHGSGKPPRWTWNGDAEKPTFRPSVLVRYEHWVPPAMPNQPPPESQEKVIDVCHSFVTDGRIEFLGDCTHALAGQTVDLPEWTE